MKELLVLLRGQGSYLEQRSLGPTASARNRRDADTPSNKSCVTVTVLASNYTAREKERNLPQLYCSRSYTHCEDGWLLLLSFACSSVTFNKPSALENCP